MDAIFVATQANAMALLPTVCPKTVGLFEDPTVSENSWDAPVAAAWAWVLAGAPNASTLLDFSCPMADTTLQRHLVDAVTRQRVFLVRQSLTPGQCASVTSHGGDGHCWFRATPSTLTTSSQMTLLHFYRASVSDFFSSWQVVRGGR